MKLTIAKKQKNALILFGIIFLTAVAAFVFIYKPKEAEAVKLKNKLKAIEVSLKNIHNIVGSDAELGKGILRLRDESKAFDVKFIKPEAVSGLLETLSSDARGHGLDLISMNPSEFSACRDAKGKAIKFDDMECQDISVEMQLTGSYRQIIDYLDTLENKNTLQLKVEKFSIDRQDKSGRLRIHIVVDSFALMKIQ